MLFCWLFTIFYSALLRFVVIFSTRPPASSLSLAGADAGASNQTAACDVPRARDTAGQVPAEPSLQPVYMSGLATPYTQHQRNQHSRMMAMCVCARACATFCCTVVVVLQIGRHGWAGFGPAAPATAAAPATGRNGAGITGLRRVTMCSEHHGLGTHSGTPATARACAIGVSVGYRKQLRVCAHAAGSTAAYHGHPSRSHGSAA